MHYASRILLRVHRRVPANLHVSVICNSARHVCQRVCAVQVRERDMRLRREMCGQSTNESTKPNHCDRKCFVECAFLTTHL
jgi:hypothetical protein